MTARMPWRMFLTLAALICAVAGLTTFALSGGDNPAAAAPGPTATASTANTDQPTATMPTADPSRTPVPHTIVAPPGAVRSDPIGTLPRRGGVTSAPGTPPADVIAELLPGTTAFQEKLLQDGDLTRDEYESAVFATVQCIADNGFIVTGPEYDNQGYLVFQFGTRATALGGQYSLVSDSCASQYSRDVSVVWSAVLKANAPLPSADAISHARSEWAACLVSSGVKGLGPDSAVLEMYNAVLAAGKSMEVYSRCRNDVEAKYGFSPDK